MTSTSDTNKSSKWQAAGSAKKWATFLQEMSLSNVHPTQDLLSEQSMECLGKTNRFLDCAGPALTATAGFASVSLAALHLPDTFVPGFSLPLNMFDIFKALPLMFNNHIDTINTYIRDFKYNVKAFVLRRLQFMFTLPANFLRLIGGSVHVVETVLRWIIVAKTNTENTGLIVVPLMPLVAQLAVATAVFGVAANVLGMVGASFGMGYFGYKLHMAKKQHSAVKHYADELNIYLKLLNIANDKEDEKKFNKCKEAVMKVLKYQGHQESSHLQHFRWFMIQVVSGCETEEKLYEVIKTGALSLIQSVGALNENFKLATDNSNNEQQGSVENPDPNASIQNVDNDVNLRFQKNYHSNINKIHQLGVFVKGDDDISDNAFKKWEDLKLKNLNVDSDSGQDWLKALTPKELVELAKQHADIAAYRRETEVKASAFWLKTTAITFAALSVGFVASSLGLAAAIGSATVAAPIAIPAFIIMSLTAGAALLSAINAFRAIKYYRLDSKEREDELRWRQQERDTMYKDLEGKYGKKQDNKTAMPYPQRPDSPLIYQEQDTKEYFFDDDPGSGPPGTEAKPDSQFNLTFG